MYNAIEDSVVKKCLCINLKFENSFKKKSTQNKKELNLNDLQPFIQSKKKEGELLCKTKQKEKSFIVVNKKVLKAPRFQHKFDTNTKVKERVESPA